MRASLTALLALTVASGCAASTAKGTSPAAALSGSADREQRCAAVADSVRAATPVAELPDAVPVGRPRYPIPRNIPGGEVQTTFLVDPAGLAVRGTVVTIGGADQEYRSRMEDVVLRSRFRPPTVGGCPSWSRGDIRLRAQVEVRRMER